MNNLTKFLVDSILNEDKVPGKTALFGGGFKPPTRGHLEVVTQGLKDNPEVDEVYIFVGSGVRNNISQEEAIKIWEMFKPFISVKSTIIKAGSPLKDMKRFIEDMEDKPYVFIGARPNNEDDDKDVAERSKFFEKYGGIPKRVNTSDSAISGTRARNAAKADNKQELFSYFPEGLTDTQKEEIYDMLRSIVKEQVNFKSLEQQLDNMFAELDIDVAFTTHFKERVLERGLTEDDILELAEKIIDAYPDQLDFLNQGQNIVMSHLSRLVDIAAVNTGYGDDYLKDLVFKTAYKRKDKSEPEFRTNASSPRLAVNEGRYDSISRQLASIALNAWKSDFKDGASYGYFVGKITPEEYPTDLTFTFKALGRFVDGGYKHNGYSKADGEIGVKYEIPKDAIPQIWEEVYMDLISTIRHEIEHQTQGGKNVKQGKEMTSDKELRKLIAKGGNDIVKYVTLPKEIESNVHGLYLKAKKWRRPYEEVVDEYIKNFLKITNPADVNYVKVKWQEVAKKRSLPSLLKENASYSKDINILEKLTQLTQHMIDKGYNIEPLPGLELINGDTENARDFFGKTAYYDPNTQTIVLYTEGRHPKDIARSYAHEMIHHMQNLEGRLGNITTTNTQEDDHLNNIEAEANLKGTMTFRNWTDSLTENQEPDRVKFIKYLEKLIK